MKRFLRRWYLVMFLFLFACSYNSEIQKKYNSVTEKIVTLGTKVKEIKESIFETTERIKNKTLTATEGIKISTELYNQLNETNDSLQNVLAEKRELDILIKENKTNGWMQLVYIAVALATTGGLAKKVLTLLKSRNTLISAIDKGSTQKEIKVNVSNAEDVSINKEIQKRKRNGIS